MNQRRNKKGNKVSCLSGHLGSSTSVQKLFCGNCSRHTWSFDAFVGEKVVSPSYSSAIWREGTHVCLWPIHVDVWQKPSQYCKVIILLCMYINIYVCVYVYMCVCIYICVCVYTHTHTHTHTYCTTCHVELPWPGIKLVLPAVETLSLNHWITKKVQ